MPVYEYQCKACHREFEYQQRMSEPEKTTCEACGKEELERLISRTAFQLKGGGWYKDLYSSAKPGSSDASGGSSASATTPAAADKPAAAADKPAAKAEPSGGSSGGGSSTGGSSSGGTTGGSSTSSGGGSSTKSVASSVS